jgi:uncharacterized protein YecE (DUF72 family)
MSGHLKIGCCGFPVKKTEYAAVFSVVEVQQTFYQPPRIATLQRWRELVPADFEFVIKAWQLITHTFRSPTYRRLKASLEPKTLEQCGSFRSTPPVMDAWNITLASAMALKARRVLFQCPASFIPDPQNISQMQQFFSTVDRAGLQFLWEPRGAWPPGLIQLLCRELDLTHVVDPFLSRPTAQQLLYFRLHGGKDFKHVFSDVELQFVHNLIPKNLSAYVMFNNIAMWQDARRFAAIKANSP